MRLERTWEETVCTTDVVAEGGGYRESHQASGMGNEGHGVGRAMKGDRVL